MMQVGFDRAGFYRLDLLDDLCASARQVCCHRSSASNRVSGADVTDPFRALGIAWLA